MLDVDGIQEFRAEFIFQHIFSLFPQKCRTLTRSFGLKDNWVIGNRDQVNTILNTGVLKRYYPILNADSGLVDVNHNVLPIELETIPSAYLLVQAPHYCARARTAFYHNNKSLEVDLIRTLVIAIDSDELFLNSLNNSLVSMKVISPGSKHSLKIVREENPVLYFLQILLEQWNKDLFENILDDQHISMIGKVFISCWLLELGDESTMEDVNEVISKRYGSPEEMGQLAIQQDGIGLFRYLTPEQIAAIPPDIITAFTPEQLSHLTPEQVASIPAETLSALTPEQVASIPAETLSALTPEQLSHLPPDKIIQTVEKSLPNLSLEALEELIEKKRKLT